MTIFKHFGEAIYSKAKLSKIADFLDEIVVVNRGEGEMPWVRGYGQITCANFNGVKIAFIYACAYVDVDFYLTM